MFAAQDSESLFSLVVEQTVSLTVEQGMATIPSSHFKHAWHSCISLLKKYSSPHSPKAASFSAIPRHRKPPVYRKWTIFIVIPLKQYIQEPYSSIYQVSSITHLIIREKTEDNYDVRSFCAIKGSLIANRGNTRDNPPCRSQIQ